MVLFKVAYAKYGVLLSLCASTIAVPFHTDVGKFRRADDFYLRILPLGDSITKGDLAVPGTNGNGYRESLRDQLRSDGWQVNMVGTQLSGTMQDNNSEGHSDAKIDLINGYARPALYAFKPNVVLINVGTNDATQNYEVSRAGTRIRGLITDCLTLSPGTVVILSTLIPNSIAPTEVAAINDQLRDLSATLRNEDLHVVLAEMDDGSITVDDLWDGTQPNLGGFQKMAAVWHHAINEAETEGWLEKPSDNVQFEDDDEGEHALP